MESQIPANTRNQKIYSVYDAKAVAYIQPFFAPTDGIALRMFGQAASDENHQFARWEEDYTLYRVGEFNDDTGEIIPGQLTMLGTATTIRAALKEKETNNGG